MRKQRKKPIIYNFVKDKKPSKSSKENKKRNF